MNKNEQSHKQSLNDRSWEVLMGMRQSQKAEDAQKLMEDETLSAEMDAFFAEHDAQYHAQIDNYFKQKRHRRNHAARPASRMARGIAAGLVVMVALSGTALAFGKDIKNWFDRLTVEQHEEYTTLDIRNQRDALDVGVEHGIPIAEAQEGELNVPEGWEGTYFPSIVPEGLVVSDVSSSIFECDVAYSLPGEYVRRFAYTETTGGGGNIDSEDSEIRTIVIYGCEGTVLIKKDRVIIYWFNGKTLFMVTTYGYTADEALMYAGSLRKVKR